MRKPQTLTSPGFLTGGSTMAYEILGHDWQTHAPELGALENWPDHLKTTLAIMLDSPQGIFVGWGPNLRLFYNDAYRPMLGLRAKRSLSLPFSDV